MQITRRFTDGGQFGLGAEVAVGTQKLQCSRSNGIKLTSYKMGLCQRLHTSLLNSPVPSAKTAP